MKLFSGLGSRFSGLGLLRAFGRPATSNLQPQTIANRAAAPVPGPAGPAPKGAIGRGRDTADLVAAANNWREQYNPLVGLIVRTAVARLDAARRGDFPELQWTYREIEGADETLLALIERRTSALKQLDDDVKRPGDDDLPAGVSPAQADEQVAYLKAVHARVTNHRAAIEHLALAKFRGYAHVQFQLGAAADGEATRLALPADIAASDEPVTWVPVDPWNITRDGLRGDWFYNSSAQSGATASSLGEANRLDERAMLVRECARPINRIALFAFIRKTMAEKDWDGFVEIFGIPQPIINLPPDVKDDTEGAQYVAAAAAVASGGSGVLAHGSEVKYPDAAKNAPPFRDHIKWQQEKVVLAGTGGKLTMLAESGTGTLGGGAHADTFEQIARAEALEVSELINRGFDEPLLRAKFPGQVPVAYWQLCADEQSDTGKVATEIKTLADAGYQVDPEQVSERTSYQVTLKPTPAVPTFGQPATSNLQPATLPNRAPGSPSSPGAKPQTPDPIAAAIADAQRSDRAFVLTRLMAIRDIADPELRRRKLQEFRDSLPQLAADLTADPAAAAEFQTLLGAALAEGLQQPGSTPAAT